MSNGNFMVDLNVCEFSNYLLVATGKLKICKQRHRIAIKESFEQEICRPHYYLLKKVTPSYSTISNFGTIRDKEIQFRNVNLCHSEFNFSNVKKISTKFKKPIVNQKILSNDVIKLL